MKHQLPRRNPKVESSNPTKPVNRSHDFHTRTRMASGAKGVAMEPNIINGNCHLKKINTAAKNLGLKKTGPMRRHGDGFHF